MNLVDLIFWHGLYLMIVVAAITAALLAGIWLDIRWCRNVFRPWDYLGAAVFGGDGRHSISAYCGRAKLNGGPRVLVWIGGVIDARFGAGHCTDAARNEELI